MGVRERFETVTPDQLLPLLKKVKQNGMGWRACCPAHDDSDPSLSVSTGTDGRLLVKCHAQECSYESILRAVGLWRDVAAKPMPKSPKPAVVWRGETVAYAYRDESRRTLYENVRQPLGYADGSTSKDFFQRRPDGKGGYINGLGDVRRVPYGLPELRDCLAALKDSVVLFCEGEQDVDNVQALGFAATNLKNWQAQFNQHLTPTCHVVMVIDHDESGVKQATKTARLLSGAVASVRWLDLYADAPMPPDHGPDVSDWLQAGHTSRELLDAVKQAPHWPLSEATSAPDPPKPARTVSAAGGPVGTLIDLAQEAELWHTSDGEAYATFPVRRYQRGHEVGRVWETWPVNSAAWRDWLHYEYWRLRHVTPKKAWLDEATATCRALARMEGPQYELFTRVAYSESLGGPRIYLDLANDAGQVVEVRASGWDILSQDVPVRFRRARGLAPLPVPVSGGQISDLRPFVNCREEDFPLLVGWLLAAYRPDVPAPILILSGEQRSAKSTTMSVLRGLVDPNLAVRRAIPENERDLMISAQNSWCLTFDNLERLPSWLSNAFCRLSTGGGFATRKLHTDAEEMLFDGTRPIALNGIEEIATRPDLLSRAFSLTLPPLSNDTLASPKKFERDFQAARPMLLGAVLDAVACGLRSLSDAETRVMAEGDRPRLVDTAIWVEAAGDALGWPQGTFWAAYQTNQSDAQQITLEHSPVSAAVIELVNNTRDWTGTASELLARLSSQVGEEARKQWGWPRTPQGLGASLSRLAPLLRRAGVEVERLARSDQSGTRRLRLYLIGQSDPREVEF